MSKLNDHFEAMQEMCCRYLEPNGYYIDREGTIWRGDDVEPSAFISDMIYMLDGPEQREAQEAAAIVDTHPQGGDAERGSVHG